MVWSIVDIAGHIYAQTIIHYITSIFVSTSTSYLYSFASALAVVFS